MPRRRSSSFHTRPAMLGPPVWFSASNFPMTTGVEPNSAEHMTTGQLSIFLPAIVSSSSHKGLSHVGPRLREGRLPIQAPTRPPHC